MALASPFLASVAIFALGNTAPAFNGFTGHASPAIDLISASDAHTASGSGGAATHHQPASTRAEPSIHDLSIKSIISYTIVIQTEKLLPELSTRGQD